jgi:hypothetical protein
VRAGFSSAAKFLVGVPVCATDKLDGRVTWGRSEAVPIAYRGFQRPWAFQVRTRRTT